MAAKRSALSASPFQRATCVFCGRSVAMGFVGDLGLLTVHQRPLVGTLDDSPEGLVLHKPGACITEDGRAAREDPRGTMLVWRLHRGLCPELKRRRLEAIQQGRNPDKRYQTPDAGTCRRCSAPILWIHTSGGSRVPLDPAPIEGVVLDLAEARELRGGPELVRGYDLAGDVLAIRRDGLGQLSLLDQGRERATVHVTHFATCPQAAAERANRSPTR